MTSLLNNKTDTLDDAKAPLGGAGDVAKVPTAAELDKMTPAQKEREIEQQRKDAAQKEGDKKKEGSLRITIHLDLDVEVHLTARVKGDIVIGLL